MQPTTPRLSSDVSAQPGYAPIAWLAVAALGLAGVFVVVLLALAIGSYFKGLPLTDSWIPFVPALVVVLAFVARRQIRASEGTRTGEGYANAAWWIAVVSGVMFVAYLLAINFTVQRDARGAFDSWAAGAKELDPFNLKDPNVFKAAWYTLPPGTRPASPADVTRMETAFADHVAGFRQTDVARIIARNRGTVELRPEGLKDWTVKANEIDCVLTATLTCPEGVFGLELPMRAAVDDKGQRRWQIKPAGTDGYVKSALRTRFGWEAALLEAEGVSVGREVFLRLASVGQTPVLYLGYTSPTSNDPNKAAAALNQFRMVSEPLAAAGGGVAQPACQPLPLDWAEQMMKTLFVKPDGTPHPLADAERLFRIFNTGGQVSPAGGVLKVNPDVNPVLAVRPEGVEMRVPAEMPTGAGGQAPSAYKAKLVFGLPAAAAQEFLAARSKASASDAKTTEPPADLTKLTRKGWRLLRVETDLKPVQGEAPQQGPPGRG